MLSDGNSKEILFSAKKMYKCIHILSSRGIMKRENKYFDIFFWCVGKFVLLKKFFLHHHHFEGVTLNGK